MKGTSEFLNLLVLQALKTRLTRSACLEVADLMQPYTDDVFDDSSQRLVSNQSLRQWITRGGGPTANRRLRNWMDSKGYVRSTGGGAGTLRAQDVFWSWIAYCLEPDTPSQHRFMESANDPVRHPRISQENWQVAVAHRCGWTLGIGGSTTRIFVSLADRLLNWLRKRAAAHTSSYFEERRAHASTYVSLAEARAHPQLLSDSGEHAILPDCMYLSDEGEVDCTRAVLQLAKQNLNDSFLPYGGANTYWAAAVYLALRGDIVGDIRRGDSYLSADEDIWMSESVSYLLSERLIDASAADRLLHRGKWESYTPPLPKPDQRYLIDMFCGGMSLYHNCLQYTDLACVTIDYQRSIKRKSSNQTCRYVRPHLIMDIRHTGETTVETALQQLRLQGSCLQHGHASPPCTSHSTVNATNRDRGNAYGIYGQYGTDCPMYRHDVDAARAAVASLQRVQSRWGASYDVENPGAGTFQLLDFIQALPYCEADYCCYGYVPLLLLLRHC